MAHLDEYRKQLEYILALYDVLNKDLAARRAGTAPEYSPAQLAKTMPGLRESATKLKNALLEIERKRKPPSKRGPSSAKKPAKTAPPPPEAVVQPIASGGAIPPAAGTVLLGTDVQQLLEAREAEYPTLATALASRGLSQPDLEFWAEYLAGAGVTTALLDNPEMVARLPLFATAYRSSNITNPISALIQGSSTSNLDVLLERYNYISNFLVETPNDVKNTALRDYIGDLDEQERQELAAYLVGADIQAADLLDPGPTTTTRFIELTTAFEAIRAEREGELFRPGLYFLAGLRKRGAEELL